MPATLILKAAHFRQVVETWAAPPALDYETNGLRFWQPGSRIAGIALAATLKDRIPQTWYIPVAHQQGPNAEPAMMAAFTEWLSEATVVAYHLSTEVSWSVAKFGIAPRVVGDAYLAARLLQLKTLGLKDLIEVLYGRTRPLRIGDLVEDFDFSKLASDATETLDYAGRDAFDALDAASGLATQIRTQGMQAAYELELLAAMLLAEQEAGGYRIDTEKLQLKMVEEEDRLAGLELRIWHAFGGKPFNLRSPVELGTRLRRLGVRPRKTSLGNDSWSLDSLKAIPTPPPVVLDLIEWKKAQSVAGSIRRAPVTPDATGRIWPHWLSMGVSGSPRIYSERPSLTSYPKVARSAFVAPPGTRWGMVAYLQPEMRALAMLADEPAMRSLLNTEFDFYMTVGATLRGAQPGDGTPEDRATAKALLYAMHDYAGDVARVTERLGVADASLAVSQVYQLFPRLQSYFAEVRRQAATGTVTSFLHRRWKLAPKEDPVTAAMTVLSQHTVATWLKFVLCKVASHAELRHPGLRGFGQVIPVFDRFYYVIDAAVGVHRHVAYMQSICEPTFKGVRFRAEYGMGPTWGDVPVLGDLAFAQATADFAKAD